MLVRPEQRRYFFDNLQNPAWVKPLAERGFFAQPPDPVRDDDRGTIAFPPWPEGRFLARMAASAPQDVLEVIQGIPPSDNVRVHEDFLDAALAMPPHVANMLVRDVSRWLAMAHPLLLPDQAGRLVAHLANGGEIAGALSLAREVLRVVPDPRPGLAREPVARYNDWEYAEIVRRHVPVLVRAAGQPVLAMLCATLNGAVLLSVHEDGTGTPIDYSYIWRRAIEDHEQDGPGSIKSILVTAVRDAALSIVDADPTSLQDTIRELEKHEWNVFQRIALFVLSQRVPDNRDLVAERVCDRTLFMDPGVRHEYANLLGRAFRMLNEAERATVLGWISRGPDRQELRERLSRGDEGTDEEDVEQYVRVWTRDRLAWIGEESLPPEWARRYQELVDAFGNPEHPDFASWSGGVLTGPNSPKTADELNSMPAIDVVGFLRKWRPDEDVFMGPSPEGLGRTLAAAVAEKPSRYTLVAPRFRHLDPTYVRALFTGLKDALQAGRTFEWPSVLALCKTVALTPWPIAPGDRRLAERDLEWSPTTQAIAELLSAAFDKDAVAASMRTSVWEVLRPLTADPEPTPEYEEQYGGSNMDPLTVSINTARGTAMHGLVRYALWLRRAAERGDPSFDQPPHLSDGIAQVKDVLEFHLHPNHDPALAVRAVYGQWLPWLLMMDRGWTQAQLPAIFPADPLERVYLDAAWETYLNYSRLFDDAFELLRSEYSRAVERIGTADPKIKRRVDPDGRLGEHLMVMYWRGKLSLGANDLVLHFFARAPDVARGHALGFVGRTARATNDEALDPGLIMRLQELWETRLAIISSAQDQMEYRHELSAFGWWFTSNTFDSAWSLPQLLTVLRFGGWPEPDHLVVERLASLSSSPSMTAAVVECLALLVHADKEGWRTYGWREGAKKILAAGVASSDPNVRDLSRDAANWLGETRGLPDFRELVRMPPPSARPAKVETSDSGQT